jgi:formylglycine-generating enzyme required for sulfatase activity
MKRYILPLLASALVASVSLHADTFGTGANQFNIDFTSIGNAGNTADTTGYGAVGYTYRMGTYTISQNQVNAAIANGLQNVTTSTLHDAIQLVSATTCPATRASWFEAAAFCNWLNTSSGYAPAYNLSFTSGSFAMTVWSGGDAGYNSANPFRNLNAVYFLPSVDEWFKAAYYNPATSSYTLYTTASDTAPSQVSNSGTGAGGAGWNSGGAGTSPGTTVYGLASWSGTAPTTAAGGLSAYGTMGQGGNAAQWTETSASGINNDPNANRIGLGYSFADGVMSSANDTAYANLSPTTEIDTLGFRVASVASVPEPSTYALFGIGAIGMLMVLRRKKVV